MSRGRAHSATAAPCRATCRSSRHYPWTWGVCCPVTTVLCQLLLPPSYPQCRDRERLSPTSPGTTGLSWGQVAPDSAPAPQPTWLLGGTSESTAPVSPGQEGTETCPQEGTETFHLQASTPLNVGDQLSCGVGRSILVSCPGALRPSSEAEGAHASCQHSHFDPASENLSSSFLL